MNLIVGLLILSCLVGSELVGSQAADDVWLRLSAVIAAVAAIPCLAYFQTRILLGKFRQQELGFESKQSLCRRMTATHSIAWLSAGLALVWAIRWQDVVRGNWQLDHWPLLDELVILAPIVFSMVASWAIFYELQLAIDETEPDGDEREAYSTTWRTVSKFWSDLRPRIGFVSIRFRLYFLLILIPVSVFVVIRDCSAYLPTVSAEWAAYIALPVLLGLVVLFPFLTMLIWKTEQIDDPELQAHLRQVSHDHSLNVWAIRVWKTGDQIVNAAVAGVLPKFRVILMSDGLLKLFPQKEIEAVIRHEAGHIRLWHLPIRLFFLVLPLVGLGLLDSRLSQGANLPENWLWVAIPTSGYLVYFVIITRWLSHQMEFEADMYSIEVASSSRMLTLQEVICPNRSDDMRGALLRLAAISPEQYEKNGLFHPSLRRRIEFIDQVMASPARGRKFRKAFARRRWMIGVTLVVVTCLVLAIY
jgi:Zn-dependent protease with chaperone function